MIIIKIIIIYFIQIRHTDDFHSTGTRLVLYYCININTEGGPRYKPPGVCRGSPT